MLLKLSNSSIARNSHVRQSGNVYIAKCSKSFFEGDYS